MAVNVAAATTNGLPLSNEDLRKVSKICDEIMRLNDYYQEVKNYYYMNSCWHI